MALQRSKLLAAEKHLEFKSRLRSSIEGFEVFLCAAVQTTYPSSITDVNNSRQRRQTPIQGYSLRTGVHMSFKENWAQLCPRLAHDVCLAQVLS